MTKLERIALVVVLGMIALLWATYIFARDRDGRYAKANPELHKWFEGLSSEIGRCCSDADGYAVSDPDWQTQDKKDFPYRVLIKGEWIDVPVEAMIKEPNRVGHAMVWPQFPEGYSKPWVRCFMPGSLS